MQGSMLKRQHLSLTHRQLSPVTPEFQPVGVVTETVKNQQSLKPDPVSDPVPSLALAAAPQTLPSARPPEEPAVSDIEAGRRNMWTIMNMS